MSTKRAFVTRPHARLCTAACLLFTLALMAVTVACNSAMQAVSPGTSSGTQSPPPSDVTIDLSPANASVAAGGQLQFTALLHNTRNMAVRWSASSGTISQAGLFLAPQTSTAQTVTIVVSSGMHGGAQASTTITILPALHLAVGTTTLPSATSGLSYSATLTGTGGTSPYQWNLASGALPQGLQLSSSGVISGATSQTGSFPFSIRLQDAATNQATQSYTLTVSSDTAGGNFDGPAELPRVYVQSAISATPAPGKTVQVNSGGDFQSALDNAKCGDTIKLQAGASFPGVFYFPQKSCDVNHWIVVRTSASDSSLPPEGTRITPCYAGTASLPGRPALHCASTKKVMAQLIFDKKTGYGPVVFSSGANHYRLIGLEVTRSTGTSVVSGLITPDTGVAADHIVLDRLWVHGTAQDDTMRGAFLSGVTSIAIVDSFFNDFHCVAKTGDCVDSQAIAGGGGDLPMGPFKIVNNFLEAAAENIIFGGSAATATPADIEIRHNHFFKPMIWKKGQPGFVGGADGNPFIVKNHMEAKNAQRILFEGNVLENTWGGFSQAGYSIVLTPKNQATGDSNVCPICQVTDVTIRYNTTSHIGGVFQLANAKSDNGGTPQDGQRYSIHDIIADDISDVTYDGSGTFAQISTVPAPNLQNVRIEHVTAFQPHSMFNVGASNTQKMNNFTFINNIINASPYSFTTTGGASNCAIHTTPDSVLDSCFAPYTFVANALIALPKAYPASMWPQGNFFPDSASDAQFVSYKNGNGGDYHLLSTSPYKNAGTDGRDLGADVDAVMAKIAGAR